MPYAMSVIISRAIPEIDGFKPSHRKLLYTMYKMGLINSQKIKSANVVGRTMQLNPHGDAAIYETMVRLTRGNEALLHPLVDSKGNFGKVYSRDMAYAASRYTEVKLDPICNELFRDIDSDTVDFVDNYDGTMKEPVLLPVTFPTVLTGANQGIAVGMASNICSFNLREVCDATIAYLKDEDADIYEIITAPDFPTGGTIICEPEAMKEILATGRGSFKIRGSYEYNKKENVIEIKEIPYTTTIEAIIDKIVENIKGGKLSKEIADVRDETDLKGLKIAIDLKRGVDPDALMLKLYKMTPLQDSFGCNFNLIVNNEPDVYGVGGIILEWSKFRINCVRRRLLHEIKKKTAKLHLLEGLKKILLDLDKAIAIIRETEDDSMVVPNLMAGFGIDEVQAEFIAEIKLRNLNKKYILNRIADVDDLKKELKELKYSAEHEEEIKKIIIAELEKIKEKYGIDRKTAFVPEGEVDHYEANAAIEDYNLKLFITKQHYIKKIRLTSLKTGGEHKLKDGDKVSLEIDETNLGEILVFTNQFNAYKLKIHEIPDTKLSNFGEYLPSLLEMEPDEVPVQLFTTGDYKGFFLFVFENGKTAKVPVSAYQTKTNRKRLIKAYSDASPIIRIFKLQEDVDLALFSNMDKALVINTSLVNLKTTRDTIGVQTMRLKNAKIKKAALLSETRIKEPEYYLGKTIPLSGCSMRMEDKGFKQLKLF
ncbi:MAG: topoisomerase IV [Clostridia bacterium]|nr:topoisomerase IV [Clostridia bacterium]